MHNIRVRVPDTDALGFVYHGRYFEWLDDARVHMLDAIHFSYSKMIEHGIHLPLVDAQAAYKKPLFFDDRITVHCYIREIPKARIFVDYEIMKGDELMATGKTTHIFLGKGAKPTRAPQAFLNAVKPYFS